MSKEAPAFIIDCSVLKDMFEGKNKGKSGDLLKKFKDINDMEGKIVVVTTLSSFLRAIYLADPEVKIGKIQKTLSFLKVFPSSADFKQEGKVMDEIIEFAHIISGGRNNEPNKRRIR